MGKIWLVTCGSAAISWIYGEVAARDAGARFLRCGAVRDLPGMAAALGGHGVAVALCSDGAPGSAIDEVVAALARTQGVDDVLVFTSCIDAGRIACWFYAGATEVIAAGGAEPYESSGSLAKASMGREPLEEAGAGVPAGDGAGTGAPADGGAGAEGLASDFPDGAAAFDDEGSGSLAALESLGRSGEAVPGAYDELDEPPWEPVRVAAAKIPKVDGPAASAEDKREPAARTDARGAGAKEPREREEAPRSGGASGERRAPVVAVISGRGGCGKSTLVAAMAACAARAGLRAAVLDLDLMFGNLHEVLGAASFKGFEMVGAHATEEGLAETDIEGAAMRVGPGLTLWGACEEPEQAELMGDSAEQLIEVLRGIADVIYVDTSVHWSDAVAMAVGECDRCVVVGSAGTSAVAATKRAIALAMKLGVPATRMTFVFNRLGAKGCGEDQALAFEMGVSLHSRARIPDGGDEVAEMLSFAQVDGIVAGQSPFAEAVRALTGEMLRELGCPIEAWLLAEERARGQEGGRARLRLPWKKPQGGAR